MSVPKELQYFWFGEIPTRHTAQSHIPSCERDSVIWEIITILVWFGEIRCFASKHWGKEERRRKLLKEKRKHLWKKDQIVRNLWSAHINVMSLHRIAAQVNIIGLLCVSNDP